MWIWLTNSLINVEQHVLFFTLEKKIYMERLVLIVLKDYHIKKVKTDYLVINYIIYYVYLFIHIESLNLC